MFAVIQNLYGDGSLLYGAHYAVENRPHFISRLYNNVKKKNTTYSSLSAIEHNILKFEESYVKENLLYHG